MNIKIKGYGLLGPMLAEHPELSVDEAATVEQVLEQLQNSVPAFEIHRQRTAVAIGDSLVKGSYALNDGCELVLIPPVGGG